MNPKVDKKKQANSTKLLALLEADGVLRARDLAEAEIPRMTLTRLVRSGQVVRIGRGLYSLPDADVTEHHSLAQACKRVPHGVICLLSALRFHGLTTEQPFEVWLAISRKARKPRANGVPLRIVRFSERALTEGVATTEVERVRVRITTPARTVADCFRYRNKIGLDVAIEALRDFRNARQWRIDELWEAAAIARVKTVIRPYLEALA